MTPFLKRLLLWTVVCSVSAAPSFVIARELFVEPEHTAAMILGVVVFIFAYAIFTGHERFRRLRRNRYARRSIYAAYVTRLAITVIYPVGMFVDMMCGMVSTGFVGAIGFDVESFFPVFLTTLVQGGVLNVLLLLLMLVLYGIQRVFGRKLPDAGCCERCGYDLRASLDVCPECGRAIPSGAGEVGAASELRRAG